MDDTTRHKFEGRGLDFIPYIYYYGFPLIWVSKEVE